MEGSRRDRTRRDQLAQLPQRVPAQFSQLDPDQAADLLHSLLDELPPPERLVLLLLHVERRPIAEVCELTGWTRTTVYVRAFRARSKVRALCARLGLVEMTSAEDVQAALRVLSGRQETSDDQ